MDSFRGKNQVEKQPGRCCHSRREANRHSSLLLPGRAIDRTTALIPADGGEQYLQQHAAALSRPEGEESSCLQVQRAQAAEQLPGDCERAQTV